MPCHLVFSDAHANPKESLDRFVLLNRLIHDVEPSLIIDLGDGGDYDSLGTYCKKGSRTDHVTSTLKEECEYVAESRRVGYKDVGEIEKHKRKGNHEYRFDRALEEDPHIISAIDFDGLCETYLHYDYVYQYKDPPTEIDGILYTHTPHNSFGRAIGGVNKNRSTVLQCTKPIIFGHGHDLGCATETSSIIGPASRMSLSAPAFMEDGTIKDYAKGNHCRWSYGLLLVYPQGEDRIPSFQYLSMRDLKELYGD